MTESSRSDPKAIADYEHQAWEGAAPLYADHIAFMTSLSGQIDLLREVGSIDESSVVLDVGCGPGLLTVQVADISKQAVGIDFSAKMISEANTRYPDLEFHVGDVEEMTFPDDTFDCAVACYCAHHLARPNVAFAELKRVLKPSGKIVIIHPIQSRQASWGSFARSVERVLPPETVPGGALLNVEEPEDFISLLSECGFENPRCEERLKPVTMPSLDTLMTAGWVTAAIDKQPSDVQEDIRIGVQENAQQYAMPDGSYEFPDRVLLAWADS